MTAYGRTIAQILMLIALFHVHQARAQEPVVGEQTTESIGELVAQQFKPPSQQMINDATMALYVEAVPHKSKETWTRGNNPSAYSQDRNKSNVRAICLGEENGQYVFLTLRFFVDPFYPNYHVQGLEMAPIPGRYRSKKNAKYTGFLSAQRVWLTQTTHTGGGQIAVGTVNSMSVKNDFELKECSMVGRFTKGCSDVDGKRYQDPIRKLWLARTVFEMEKELNGDRQAFVQTFGNHDVATIRVPKSLWKKPISHLGLKHPTQTVRLLTEKQIELFGFQFVLMSKDALKAVRDFEIPTATRKSGLYLTALHAASLLNPQWVFIIKGTDMLLGKLYAKAGITETTLLRTPAAMKAVSKGIGVLRHRFPAPK
ncbi:MAG: hypothetical protein CMH52_12510 [Myxococcales bacterium]|nr:hypothetical protein [Myxococcales bacterium]|tara:strand:- start:2073 stop:3179 length:1107 start_codon:yes stop_codon:yes gene_type:complete